jgi:hypothetical protein
MPILMSDIYAGQQGAIDTRMKRQLEEENKYKLAELMRIRDEEAQARAIKTKIANQILEDQASEQYQPPAVGQGQGLVAQMPTPNVPGDFVPQQPQGMIPQEGLTGLGGMSTPQMGPMGMQPQEGATDLGGMQPMGMTPEQMPMEQPQQQVPAQGTLMSAFDNSETRVNQATAKVDQVKQAVMEMRKAGLHDEADKYEMKSYKLKSAADDAQKTHLELAEKLTDYVGSQANGYLNAIKNPNVNPEAAWQRMLLDLSANGIDIDEEVALPPSERVAYATQAREAAISSKDQIALQKVMLTEAGKQQRANQTENLRREFQTDKNREQALNRNLKERRLTLSQSKQAFAEKKATYEALKDEVKTKLDTSKVQLAEVDKTIDDYTTRKLELDKGNLYFDTKGNAISSDDEEVRAQESKFLNDQIALLSNRKADLTGSVQDLSSEQAELSKTFAGLEKEPGAKPEAKATTGKFVYTSKADAASRKNYEAFMEQTKSIKDPAERSRVQVAAQNRMLENGFIKNK